MPPRAHNAAGSSAVEPARRSVRCSPASTPSRRWRRSRPTPSGITSGRPLNHLAPLTDLLWSGGKTGAGNTAAHRRCRRCPVGSDLPAWGHHTALATPKLALVLGTPGTGSCRRRDRRYLNHRGHGDGGALLASECIPLYTARWWRTRDAFTDLRQHARLCALRRMAVGHEVRDPAELTTAAAGCGSHGGRRSYWTIGPLSARIDRGGTCPATARRTAPRCGSVGHH